MKKQTKDTGRITDKSKTKNCPVCNSPAGRWAGGRDKGKLTCWNNECPLAELTATDEAWNALPRAERRATKRGK